MKVHAGLARGKVVGKKSEHTRRVKEGIRLAFTKCRWCV